jgi:hypothetical protein
MKHKLLKRISEIHANKCYYANDFNEAQASFEKLNKLKKWIIEASAKDLPSIICEIESWSSVEIA